MLGATVFALSDPARRGIVERPRRLLLATADTRLDASRLAFSTQFTFAPRDGTTLMDADVMVHGAGLAQSLLCEGLLDELELQLIPVTLGDGRRLFGADRVELELTRACSTRPA